MKTILVRIFEMNKTTKQLIVLYIAAVISIFVMFINIDAFVEQNVKHQELILLKQAQVHFKDQVNSRKWNAGFGGVYVEQKNNIKPNPYLKNNVLKVDENLTLIKINPAWMTRQLSELSDIDKFHFRITSLNPLNPNNKANEFEKRALEHLHHSNDKEYYELGEKFNYMGALVTEKSCLPCHKHQGYKLGDIRGGISVTLDASDYEISTSAIKSRGVIVEFYILLFISLITILIHRQIKSNQILVEKVQERTKEISTAKTILQNLIDVDLSFLAVFDKTDMILANKTLLEYFGSSSLEEFKKEYKNISEKFVKSDSNQYLEPTMDGLNWIEYIQIEQDKKELKVQIENSQEIKIFRPHSKEIFVEGKKLHIVIFDDITKEIQTIENLKDEATRDALTGLFNRKKFNEILLKEIAVANITAMPLSFIFIDIDHFKKINDTYGHNTGDRVLITLSEILLPCMRRSDFVARWGGEEFIIVLQSTALNDAANIAEKLRVKVCQHNFGEAGKQTISLGVTSYINGESEQSLTKRVDDALYEAKQSGRNRVVVK